MKKTRHKIKKIKDALNALSIANKHKKFEFFSLDQLKKYQNKKLKEIITYALKYSPFYQSFYKDIVGQPWLLSDLPILTKEVMMDNFDELVTQKKLKLKEINKFVNSMSQEDYYLGKYRVTASAGSSGHRGLFLYNRKEWATNLSTLIRNSNFMGVSPRLPRIKSAVITAGHPVHSSHLWTESLNMGIYNIIRINVEEPISKIVQRLNDHQPNCLIGYASMLGFLAEEQRQGHLKISPHTVSTVAELCTQDIADKIEQVWRVKPHNNYGLSDLGMAACTCENRNGLHLYEDFIIFEIVDENNHPVVPGQPGYKILVTSLFNYTQPLIRYEISDVMTVAEQVCECGRGLRLIKNIEGRNDDIIYLKSFNGREKGVHPFHFRGVMGKISHIKEYQIVHEQDGLHLFILKDKNVENFPEVNIKSILKSKLKHLGFKSPPIKVHLIDKINRDRGKMGKIKLVQSNIKR